jgi:hypothetical protein
VGITSCLGHGDSGVVLRARLAENEHKLIEGADEYLLLLDVLSFTSRTIAATL